MARGFASAPRLTSALSATHRRRWPTQPRGAASRSWPSIRTTPGGSACGGAQLSVFDGYGGDTPTALAVGRIDPKALPTGRRVIVSAGGDAGDGSGARRWGLNTHHGWTLALTDAPLSPGEAEGCVGAIG